MPVKAQQVSQWDGHWRNHYCGLLKPPFLWWLDKCVCIFQVKTVTQDPYLTGIYRISLVYTRNYNFRYHTFEVILSLNNIIIFFFSASWDLSLQNMRYIRIYLFSFHGCYRHLWSTVLTCTHIQTPLSNHDTERQQYAKSLWCFVTCENIFSKDKW